MSIWKDYLLVRAPAVGKPPVETNKEPTALACFHISPEDYEHLWTLPGEEGYWSEQPPAIADGYVYARLIGPRLLCIEVATGKIVAAEENRVGFSAGTLVYADGRLIVDRDGSHSATELCYFEVDPQRGILQQLGEPWLPPHAHGTTYHPTHSFPYVDGRLLIRGADAIYCYDLRNTRPQ
jgi:outer membrane protein assembly factor BamB